MTNQSFQIAVFETAFLSLAILLAALFVRGKVNWRWLLSIPLISIVKKLVTFAAADGTFGDWIGGSYNWEGKILASGLLVALIIVLFRNDLKAIGLTLSQNGPRPKLGLSVAVFTLFATVAFFALYFPGTKQEPLVDMLYQATMPSIEEELWYRGLMIAMLLKGLSPAQESLSEWAPFILAGLISSLQFWAAHSIGTDGDWGFIFQLWFNPVSGILGLLWVTVRLGTGSLLLPVLLHTVANTVGYFI